MECENPKIEAQEQTPPAGEGRRGGYPPPVSQARAWVRAGYAATLAEGERPHPCGSPVKAPGAAPRLRIDPSDMGVKIV